MKFSQVGQGRVSPVSEVDLGIYQLQRSEKLLQERVEVLGQEAEKWASSSKLHWRYSIQCHFCDVMGYYNRAAVKLCCLMCRCKQQAKSLLKEGKKSQVWVHFLCFVPIGKECVLMNCHLFLPQALRCLRGSKRVEKKADRLFAQLETVKGILDRIANSQTDRLVRRTDTQMHWPSAVSCNTCCWPTPVNVTHASPHRTRTSQHCIALFSCSHFSEIHVVCTA